MLLQQCRLSDILPIKDAQLQAAARALDGQLQKLTEQTKLALHLPRLNELDHAMLDALADQYHCDFYEPESLSLDAKRDLIRSNLLEHRIRGTKASVELMLNKVLTWGRVSEWYEYGGEKFYFRVHLQGLKFTDEHAEKFFRIINSTKNVRSWLERLIFDLTLEPPDTALNVAQPFIDGSDNFIDLSMEQAPPQRLTTRGILIDGAADTFDLAAADTLQGALHVADIVIEVINEVHDCDRDELGDNDTAEAFERYVRERWEEFKRNPVIEHYGHHGHIWDGELDEGDTEIFPLEKNFLRLYFNFPRCTHVRYMTFTAPREDITAAEINYLSEISRASLMHSRLKIPNIGIIRALYINRKEIKVL